MKRTFDICAGLLGLIVLSPLFLITALWIKADSKGPVFYRQTRIGKDGKPFKMYKFRTMMELTHWVGPVLCPRNDPRVTRFGAILRRSKLNELPQLINVLKGEMSFVGPRPEVPGFVDSDDPIQRKVLSVRPGIVGPAQIHMRNEEELYKRDADPIDFYKSNILPEKLAIDARYVDNVSFFRDLLYLLQGVWITLAGAITARHFLENIQQVILFLCDAVVCSFSYFLAYLLRMEGQIPPIERIILVHTLPYVILIRMFFFAQSDIYSTLVRYISFEELVKIIKGATFSSIAIVVLTFLIGERGHPRSVFVMDWFIVISLLGGYRMAFKAIARKRRTPNQTDSRRILIYGAHGMGDLALRYLRMEDCGTVIGFVDDDPQKIKKHFQGLKVLGDRYDIEALVGVYGIDQVIIPSHNLSAEDLNQIKGFCKKAGVACEVFALAN